MVVLSYGIERFPFFYFVFQFNDHFRSGSCRLGLAAPLEAFRPPAQFISGSRPDQSEGARILQTFQQAGISGYYWLAFELRVMPRQGADRTIIGELHGGRNALGPISRLTLPAAAGEQRWLLQSGPHPATWQWLGGAGEPTALTSNESRQAIAGRMAAMWNIGSGAQNTSVCVMKYR